nr:astacin-like metalloendopeptidase [Misgurnus anguillicaudatus]
MLRFFILLAWLCEVWAGPLETHKRAAEIQSDEGYINSRSLNPNVLNHPETVMDLSDDDTLEGDILRSKDRNAVSALWPEVDGAMSVPYEIHFDLENRTPQITEALKMISNRTCIKFHPHRNETDYLIFQYGQGCASYVGCLGGEQMILVGPQCKVGNICHEVLHSLGLYHEHSRHDREKYITILFENVVSGKEEDFKVKEGNTLGINYDVGSILHYGSNYFSRNGKPTIVPKDGAVKIGQRTHLSELDVARLRKLYHCDRRENKV